MPTNPIICAIDTPDLNHAIELCQSLQSSIGMAKLGLEFFCTHGPNGIKAVHEQSQLPIFLDLKLHDIPNTVAKSIETLMSLPIELLTIHTSGGSDMMKAAIDKASETCEKLGKKRPTIVGVTVLTSLDQSDLHSMGINHSPLDQVKQLAALAQSSKLDGVVCSPFEIEAVKKECGTEFITVVPGIRLDSGSAGDQKRVLTPQQAKQKGADYMVIGRPITQASSPRDAAQAILDSLTS